MPAPIALFAYSRPDHLSQTVAALARNALAGESELYAFCDGPKNDAVAKRVFEVRDVVRSISGFKAVHIFESEKNRGLANSVIRGVSQVLEQHDRVIVVEDDLITAPDFLSFMNRLLDHYRTEGKVFSISGFNYPIPVPDGYDHDVVFSYRPMSWGWGMWSDRWRKIDWSVSDFSSFKKDRKQRKLFERGGSDLPDMLQLQIEGKLDSWAIRWAYAHYKNDSVAAIPATSKVLNIGFDGSGVHCRATDVLDVPLEVASTDEIRFPEKVAADPYWVTEIHAKHHRGIVRSIGHYLKYHVLR